MDTGQSDVLREILSAHTRTPGRCWFCAWDGYGWDHSVPGLPAEVLDGPRVRLPQRDYLLLKGPLDAAGELGTSPAESHFLPRPPNLFWPEDHAWCVATEIDLDSTYVGGDARLIRRILADARLEALPAGVDDPITIDSDQINAGSAPPSRG